MAEAEGGDHALAATIVAVPVEEVAPRHAALQADPLRPHGLGRLRLRAAEDDLEARRDQLPVPPELESHRADPAQRAIG